MDSCEENRMYMDWSYLAASTGARSRSKPGWFLLEFLHGTHHLDVSTLLPGGIQDHVLRLMRTWKAMEISLRVFVCLQSCMTLFAAPCPTRASTVSQDSVIGTTALKPATTGPIDQFESASLLRPCLLPAVGLISTVDIVTRPKYYCFFLLIIVHIQCKVVQEKALDNRFHR